MSFDLNDLKLRINKLEEIELRDLEETSEETYKLLLICYLLDDEPMKAKFLWKRIPSGLKSAQNELTTLWSLAHLLIQRKYSEAFDKSNELNNSNYQYTSNELKTLVNLLIEKSRERLFELINLAYSSISVKEMSNMMRLSEEEILKISLNQSWQLDDSKLFLLPKKKQQNETIGIPNQLQMEQLTKIVSFIET